MFLAFHSLLPLLPLLFLLIHVHLSQCREASLRLCEVQGTCFKCSDGHFSHFLCRSDVDCFAGESCLLQRGFCCPGPESGRIKDEKNGTAQQSAALCPDGSNWSKMCKRDEDCLFRDELCAEGKCCPSCRQRRLLALRELRSFVSSAGHEAEEEEEEFIPQCSDEGKFFRPMQCTGHSGECFCVDKFGRRRPSRREGEGGRRGRAKSLNCSSLREMDEEGDGKPLKVALSRDRWAQAKKEGEGEEEHCTDPLREFRRCGSTCPISCATRAVPRCPQEQCMRGCFCRLPYVILDASDPFGSRCVLPAECPLLQFTPDLDQWSGGFFPANQQPSPPMPSPAKRPEKCRDPLKNFQSCGSACPAGCARMASPQDCPGHCVPGCFCRVPYVLREPNEPNSECVLPQQCAQAMPMYPQLPSLLSAAAEAQLCLPERNQSWTGCFSRKCSRSCGEWPPFCVPDDCQPGCECQPPAVIRDKSARVWECILPEDCPRPKKQKQQPKAVAKDEAAADRDKCEADPRKEFLACGSSCPLGCDRLDQPLRQCSPCVSGCFCKNGFVFLNASDWRSSGCVPLNDCPIGEAAGRTSPPPPPPILFPASATTITAIQRLSAEGAPAQCSANSLDREGPHCQGHAECGIQRKCCSPNGTAPARCTCLDPSAIWTECGPVCPEFCAQSVPILCPGPCRPGCFCPPGYVKRTRNALSECVPVAQCAITGEESIDSDEPLAVDGGGQKECGEALASASLYTKEGERIGRFVARPERPSGPGTNTRRIRLSGEFITPPFPPFQGAALLLSLHQFSDTTINGCAGIGRPLKLRLLGAGNGEGGQVSSEEELTARRRADGTGTFGLDQRVEWPDPIGLGTNPLIGHSVVLQQTRGEHRVVLGCAVLGIAPSC